MTQERYFFVTCMGWDSKGNPGISTFSIKNTNGNYPDHDFIIREALAGGLAKANILNVIEFKDKKDFETFNGLP